MTEEHQEVDTMSVAPESQIAIQEEQLAYVEECPQGFEILQRKLPDPNFDNYEKRLQKRHSTQHIQGEEEKQQEPVKAKESPGMIKLITKFLAKIFAPKKIQDQSVVH